MTTINPVDCTGAKKGDTVHRLLAGVVPMDLTVDHISERLIHTKGGWTFDRATGIEEDPELGFGVAFGATGSWLTGYTPADQENPS